MSGETVSTNMNLPIPGVGETDGPDWASDLNACMAIIDAHTHSAGSGVTITPDGLNIISDLPMNINNLTLVKSVRFSSQSIPLAGASDLGCLYESGVDLYFNDGLGNQVRITQSGGVAGSPGSIAGLTSPASATYVSASSTFVWQSAASTPANMDGASFIFRNLTANSKGLTLAPPNAMGSDYTVTLPSLPASKKIMTMDASGNVGADYGVDNSTIEVSSSNLQVKDSGITYAKLAALNLVSGGSSGSYVNLTTTYSGISTLTITTSGRPVMIMLVPASSSTARIVISSASGGNVVTAFLQISRTGTPIYVTSLALSTFTGATNIQSIHPPGAVCYIDTPSAGTWTYLIEGKVGIAGQSIGVFDCLLRVYEL